MTAEDTETLARATMRAIKKINKEYHGKKLTRTMKEEREKLIKNEKDLWWEKARQLLKRC